MKSRRPSPFTQGLVAMASFVIVVAGLRAAGDILLPILFSVFLAILGVPLVRLLNRRFSIPTWGAIPMVVILFALGLAAIFALVANSVRTFTSDIGRYEPAFQELVGRVTRLLADYGLEGDQEVASLFEPSDAIDLITTSLNTIVAILSRALIVIVTMTFILFEATELELKLGAAFGTETRRLGPFTDASIQVQRYLVIKSTASLITGILITIGCQIIGLDFPILWGLIAFLLNFVPSIGSIVAAVPAIALAAVQLSPTAAVFVLLLYLSVNISIGNFLEPRFMGRSLGLSPLVVFLSLIFWGWVWGPVGMLFCVPMTVIAKLFLESQPDTRWIAVFLGSPREILEAVAVGRKP